MTQPLDALFAFQAEALKLRGYRQEVIAANIANADTPNYKAVDFDFRQVLLDATTTAAGKPNGAGAAEPTLLYRNPAQPSLDGNTVEMDAERAQFADNTVRYEAALRVLNQQIKTMLSALQG